MVPVVMRIKLWIKENKLKSFFKIKKYIFKGFNSPNSSTTSPNQNLEEVKIKHNSGRILGLFPYLLQSK